MPDISKINAVAIADIEKVDGILAADIEKVNGLVFSTAPAISAPAAAYSVRLLDTAVGVPTYTGAAMRVRRDTGGTGDDDEADIAFDTSLTDPTISLDSAISNASAGVTATTLGQFLNVGTVNGTTYTNPDSLTVTASCYVDEWKDQSGNAYHAEQDVPGSQPQIHDGTVNTDLIQENGKPALKWTGSEELNYTWPSGAGSTGDFQEDYFWTSVASPTAGGDRPVLYVQAGTNINTRMGTHYDTNSDLIMVLRVSQIATITSSTTLTAGQKLLGLQGEFTSTSDRDFTSYLNTSNVGTVNFTTTYSDNAGVVFWFLRIGAQYTQNFTGTQQEHIMYGTDVVANRTAIEVNVNNHFAIGNLPNPTSGLLATYTGAAAAYSVRQLANTAPLSMRVRRDTAGGTGDDDEADVLFDFTLTDPTISLDSRINNASAGVASTTLGEFLNATGYTDVDSLGTVADGFCDTWYDQSGAGNDAEQDVPGNQPQIFDSASPTDLIKENGKPTLDLSSRRLTASNPSSISTMSMVANRPTSGSNTRLLESRDGTSTRQAVIGYSGTTFFVMYQASTSPSASGPNLYEIATSAGQYHYFSASNTSAFCNGQTPTTTSGSTFTFGSTLNLLSINGRTTGQSISADFKAQEIVLWSTDHDDDRSGIETNINDYFSIY